MDKIHAHNIQHANIQQPTHSSAYRSRKGAKGETEKKEFNKEGNVEQNARRWYWKIKSREKKEKKLKTEGPRKKKLQKVIF